MKVHPSILVCKVLRVIRHYGEVYWPNHWLSFDSSPVLSNDCFRSWADFVPFSSDIQIKARLSSSECKSLISQADAICRHEFNLLGSGSSSLGKDIDWHTDFISGFTWPSHLLYSNVRSHTKHGADIKVPWELSRFHHGIRLSLAYLISNDSKYLIEFLYQIEHWIDRNPVGYGVNWACPMDVAIRSVNLIVSFAILTEPLSANHYRNFRLKVSDSLWKHANFLSTHLEWNGPHADSGANHLLFDLTGLLSLGLLFKNSAKGRQWTRFAMTHIEKQMERQVFADGVHFECSIGYHRLCLEAFLWCGSLAKKHLRPFSSSYYCKLAKMQAFVSDYIKPSGIVPLVGDNDDGRLINTGLLPLSDHNYLLPEYSSGSFYLDRFLLDGTTSVSLQKTTSRTSAYEDSGFFFFRTSNAKLLVRAGRLAFDGTHAHNDQLSFELSVNGTDVFVDRGTFQYSADPIQRNLFRSTEAHNTMQINNYEQNKLSSAIFTLNSETNTIVLENDKSCIRAAHKGFSNSSGTNYQHERYFQLGEKQLVIEDTVAGITSGDILHWYFHLAPGLEAFISDNGVNIFRKNALICIIKLEFKTNSHLDYFQHSPSFGKVLDSNRVHVKYVVGGSIFPYVFSYRICWE